MNLFETQDRLNSLPPSPQTLQYLSAAANGQNPNVPPWLALVRMTEIQKEMQAAQTMQQEAQGGQGKPPTVKDQVEQASGLMSLQNNRAQAGMQQLAQQAAQGQPPQGIPAVLPQAQAPQAQSPQQAFRHGGMVRRFADGGGIAGFMSEYEAIMRKREEEAERARQEMLAQRQRAREQAAQPVPIPPNPEEAYRQQYKAFGIDPAQAYAEQQRRIEALQQRQQRDEAQRAQEREQMGRYGFANALIQAGEATRGARGSGLAALLGGFGRAQGDLNTRMTDERRKSDAAMMERQSQLNELFAGLDKSRMGGAEAAASRQGAYEALKAKAAGVPQERGYTIERDILNDTANRAQEYDKRTGDVLGRAVSAAGTANTARIQGVAAERSALTAQLTPVQRGIAQLSKEIDAISKDPTLPPAAKAAKLDPMQKQQDALRTRESELLEELKKLQGALQGGQAIAGVGSPPPAGASGGSGGMLPSPAQATRAFEVRRGFPTTR